MEALAARVALIQVEAERLAQYLSLLPPDAWCQPSACQGWEVRDVLAHLIEVAQFYQRVLARGVRGEMGLPPEFVPPDTAPAAFIAQSAIARREQLGEALWNLPAPQRLRSPSALRQRRLSCCCIGACP